MSANKEKAGWEQLRYALYSVKRSPMAMLGIAMIAVVVLVAIFAPVLVPHPERVYGINIMNQLKPPSAENPCGTDNHGRDIFGRIIYGARISLEVAIVVVSAATLLGTLLGLIAGFYGGLLGNLIMRITDAFLSFPALLLALCIQAVLGPKLINTMLALTLVWWTWYCRIVRGQVISIKEELYIESAKTIGAGSLRLMFRHILPNCMGPILVQNTLQMGYAVIAAAGLGFLGVGAQEPTPEWGLMVSSGRHFLPQWWWMSAFPGLAIFWLVLGFCLLGDAARDIYERD
jgi:peptide/nickel transport system permease protein